MGGAQFKICVLLPSYHQTWWWICGSNLDAKNGHGSISWLRRKWLWGLMFCPAKIVFIYIYQHRENPPIDRAHFPVKPCLFSMVDMKIYWKVRRKILGHVAGKNSCGRVSRRDLPGPSFWVSRALLALYSKNADGCATVPSKLPSCVSSTGPLKPHYTHSLIAIVSSPSSNV